MKRPRQIPLVMLLVAVWLCPTGARGQDAPQHGNAITIALGFEGTGVLLDAQYRVHGALALGYTAMLREQFQQVDAETRDSGSAAYGVVLSVQPRRFISLYGGPMFGDVHRLISTRTGRAYEDHFSRESANGFVAGAALRVYQRSFRFYTVGARVLYFPSQSIVARADARAGVGFGIAF